MDGGEREEGRDIKREGGSKREIDIYGEREHLCFWGELER